MSLLGGHSRLLVGVARRRSIFQHVALQVRLESTDPTVSARNRLLMFRFAANQIARRITEAGYADDERISVLDETMWSKFVNKFRRDIISREGSVHLGTGGIGTKRIAEMMTAGSTAATSGGVGADGRINTKQEDMNINIDQARILISELVGLPEEGQRQRKARITTDVFEVAVQQAMIELDDVFQAHKVMSATSDLRIPHEWYPHTRLMKRKVIYHGGPTNSGKTYTALQRLRAADPEKGGGLYCGPLRLLSLEIFETLNRQGVYTSLLTGQEKQEVPGSTHTSSTVEMVSTTKEYDVAVIDEIQMIADNDRGYAWTRAMLGVRAREVHVCGGLEAKDIVKNLVEAAGDEFELKQYDRLSAPLQVHEESLKGDYSKVQPGDCIVAFSRADIFSIRKQIEVLTPYKCSVIYGQLPPETRSTQARLFNEGTNHILVASDAIGMGLNLNIGRIIFHTTLKQGGPPGGAYFASPSSVKQIAGRAGRLHSKFKQGEVTTWQCVDLAYVKAVMSWELPQITSVGIFPSVEQVELFSESLKSAIKMQFEAGEEDDERDEDLEDAYEDESIPDPNPKKKAKKAKKGKVDTPTSEQLKQEKKELLLTESLDREMQLSLVMERFVKSSKLDGRFYMCNYEALVTVSNWLHTIPLTMTDRFLFSTAPINVRDSLSMNLLYHFAALYAQSKPVFLNIRLSRSMPRDIDDFSDLCIKHNTLDLYLWLSLRFPKQFIERPLCLEQKDFAIQQIENTLNVNKLSHEYSHSSNYRKIREKASKTKGATFVNGMMLPPKEYGEELYEEVKHNMSLIDANELYFA